MIFGLPALLYTPFVSFFGIPGTKHAIVAHITTWGPTLSLLMAVWQWHSNMPMSIKVSAIITLNPIITFITMSILYEMRVSWIQTQEMDFYTWSGALLVIAGAFIVVYFKQKQK